MSRGVLSAVAAGGCSWRPGLGLGLAGLASVGRPQMLAGRFKPVSKKHCLSPHASGKDVHERVNVRNVNVSGLALNVWFETVTCDL